MAEPKLVRRETVVETYLEIAPARKSSRVKTTTTTVAKVSPTATTEVSRPREGDIVEYVSSKNRKGEYLVFWVGTVERNGETVYRVGLRLPQLRKGFFVDASRCTFLRHIG